MADEKAPVIVIKKIKKHAGGHHGGAWKVAYADFVTAMMAFFLLLWLLSSVDKNKLEGIAKYFTPVTTPQNQKSMGFKQNNSSSQEGLITSQFSDPSIVSDSGQSSNNNAPQLTQQEDTAPLNIEKQLDQALKENNDLKDFQKRVVFDQTPEGVRIQLLDDADKPLFLPGTSELQPYTKEVLKIIGNFVKFLPNYLSIEGHTTPFQLSPNMGDNWTLSSERANSTRKFMRSNSIENEQIFRVVGKADQEPLYPANPADLRNIRISLIILKNSIVPYTKKSFPNSIDQNDNKNDKLTKNKGS